MTDELFVSRSGRLGRIRLNRPAALNSLTLAMVRDFARALDDFEADPSVVAVLVTGEGERGLCAGGDIRALYDLRNGDKDDYKAFWREEYRLNARIASYPKPYVVVMDGVVMGGGVGVSAHGNRRIVTERTRIAMPETGIGFIPDVGGTWLLGRGDGVGHYMALSGVAVGAADALHVGLADLHMPSARLPEAIERLSSIAEAEEIAPVLRDLGKDAAPGGIKEHRTLLDRAMFAVDVETVLETLDRDASDFARGAAAAIRRASPTSVKVTHALLKLAQTADRLETCLVHEYRAACSLLYGRDLYEGIRAAVIDKDRRPQWSPATLDEVDGATVAAILRGTGDPDPTFAEQRR